MHLREIVLIVAGAMGFGSCAGSSGVDEDTPPAEAADVQRSCEDTIDEVAGTNNVVALDACTFDFCISVDGDTPYCSKQCAGDADCGDFTCQEIVTFGPLACADYEDPLQPRAGSSNAACIEDAQCVAPETCFSSGCGLPGRDCLTGPNGGKSTSPLRFCVRP